MDPLKAQRWAFLKYDFPEFYAQGIITAELQLCFRQLKIFGVSCLNHNCRPYCTSVRKVIWDPSSQLCSPQNNFQRDFLVNLRILLPFTCNWVSTFQKCYCSQKLFSVLWWNLETYYFERHTKTLGMKHLRYRYWYGYIHCNGKTHRVFFSSCEEGRCRHTGWLDVVDHMSTRQLCPYNPVMNSVHRFK